MAVSVGYRIGMQHILKWKGWWRLLVVIYVVSLILSVLAGIGIGSEESDSVATVMGAAGVATAMALAMVEVARRTLLYLIYGKDFLKMRFVRAHVALFVISMLAFLFGLLVHWGIDVPRQEAAERSAYEAAVAALPEATAEADACHREYEEQTEHEQRQLCESRYRAVKLGYDACREFGSHTFCLSLHDYESVSCRLTALDRLQLRQTSCYDEVWRLERVIRDYEFSNPE